MNEYISAKIKSLAGFYVSAFVLLLAFMSVGVFYYWTFFPDKILEVKELPVPVTKPQNIESGRILILKFDYCKHADVKGIVESSLVSDRNVVILPSYKEETPVGCKKIDAPMILPYTVITQKYHVHYKITYQVNPIREVVVEFDSAEFELLPIDLKTINK